MYNCSCCFKRQLCVLFLIQALIHIFKFHVRAAPSYCAQYVFVYFLHTCRVLVSAVTRKATHVQLDWFNNFLDHNSRGTTHCFYNCMIDC